MRWLAFSLCSLLLIAPPRRARGAEPAAGDLRVSVKDELGKPVAQATVQLKVNGIVRSNSTNENGIAVLEKIPAGVYSVIVQAEGFSVTEQNAVEIKAAGRLDLPFTLSQPACILIVRPPGA